MKTFKRIMLAAAMVLLSFSIAGCGFFSFNGKDFKEAALSAMDSAMRGFSKSVLTRKYRLTGDKKEGSSAYTGSYQAEYKDFTGKEALFGETGLNLGEDKKIKISYDINSNSGDCYLFRVSPNGINIIAADGEGSVEFDVKSGDNYIIFQGDHFTGELLLDSVDITA